MGAQVIAKGGIYPLSDQPCWDCKKALGGCSWSRDFTPVEGWIATPTYKAGNYSKKRGRLPPMKSYQIEYCPEFEPEERRKNASEQDERETGNQDA